MRTVKGMTICALLALCSLVLLGCSSKADENKPISEVKAEAEKMDASQLQAMAEEYKNAIVAKKGEVDKLVAKLKDIPVAEMMGAEAKEIQAEISNINKSMSALSEKLMIYYNKLKEKGGDTSDLKI